MRLLFTSLAAFLLATSVAHAAETKHPNVLFIAVDDLRPELGCYGNEYIQSPHIDALAEQSVLFTRAYCQQAVCNPSRASLLTGLRPDATRVWDLVTHFRDTIPDVVTLPQHFRQHGYYAVAYGKIFHNPLPDPASWDEPNHWPEKARNWSASSRRQLAAFRQQMRASGKREAAIKRMRAPAIEDEDVADNVRPDGEICDQAIAAMQRLAGKDQPFFLAVGFIKPHLPFNAPKRYWDLYDPAKLPLADNPLPPRGAPAMAMNTMYELRDYIDFADTPRPDVGPLTQDQQRRLKHGYYAAVSFADAQVGRLLDELDRLNLRDDTIVVLWGDHGWKLGEHRSWCKQTNYEVDTHVPLMIRSAGHKAAKCNAVVEFVDLYPTLCELAGLPAPEHLQGRSLAPLLREPDASWNNVAFSQFRRRTRDGETMGYAMRTERYRYVEWLNRATCKTVAVELYDHAVDPQENTNVATDPAQQARIGELSAQMWKAIDKPAPGNLDRPKAAKAGAGNGNAVKRPNVLFIAMDDLNDWCGCLGGHPQVLTPNLDRLAKSGLLFTNAHCAAPACNPSRTAIFTGRSPHRTGLYTNRQKMREVLPDAEIMPKTFSRQGYHSAGSGKLLHYFIDAPSWDDYFPAAERENPFPRTLYPEKRPLSLPRGGPWQYVETDWGPLDATDEEYGGDYLVAKWIAEQLGEQRDQPFFLACGIYRPHEPWFVPRKYFEPFPLESIQLPPGYKEDDLDDLPPEGKRRGPNRYFAHIREHGQWKQGIQGYLASIHFADAMLGKVLDALEEGPHADNTIVVLWSDHGWHLGEKQHWQKFTAWRVCTRVPLIVRVPAGAPGLPGGTDPGACSRPVNLLSLFPTLLELCGLPGESHHDGPSLVPLLRDPAVKWPHVSLTYLGDPGSYGLSGERWRLIHYAGGDEELYDTAADPHEWNNLSDDGRYADKLSELRAMAPEKFAPKP